MRWRVIEDSGYRFTPDVLKVARHIRLIAIRQGRKKELGTVAFNTKTSEIFIFRSRGARLQENFPAFQEMILHLYGK